MSDTLSSDDDFFDDDLDDAVNDPDMNSESAIKVAPYIDSRRRLEQRIAERRLKKDLQEFDFDI